MFLRTLTGLAALGGYGWRLDDPKTSYAVFFDISDWLTSWFVKSDGIFALGRNFLNLVLIEQADGFLLGMAFFALLSIVVWPFRACAGWCVRRVRHRRSEPVADAEPEFF